MTSDAQLRQAPDEPELMAYADGRIDAGSARGREIEAWLAGQPAARRRVQDYARQDREIRQHFAPRLAAPLPARLRLQAIRRRRSSVRTWMAVPTAASIAAVVLGWSLRVDPGARELDRFAHAVAHHLATDAVHDPIQAPHDASVAPDSLSAGFELAGMRHLESADRWYTEYAYRDADGRSLRLFVGDRQEGGEEPHWLRAGDQIVVYWDSGSRMYALSGAVSESELRRVAMHAMQRTREDLQVAEDAAGTDSQPVSASEMVSMPPHGPAELQPVMDQPVLLSAPGR